MSKCYLIIAAAATTSISTTNNSKVCTAFYDRVIFGGIVAVFFLNLHTFIQSHSKINKEKEITEKSTYTNVHAYV